MDSVAWKNHVHPSVQESMEYVLVIRDTFYQMVNVFNVLQIPTILGSDALAYQDISTKFQGHVVHLLFSNVDLIKSTVKEQDAVSARMDIKDSKDNANK